MTMTIERQCTTCGEMKTDFATGLTCRECHRQKCRDYYYAHRSEPRRKQVRTQEARDRQRAAAFIRRYSITEAQRDELLAEQGGRCAICRTAEPFGPTWCTDHDHACCPESARSCGECIRGVLCFRCNTLLGHAKDDIETLRAAIGYLEKWEARA